MSEGSAKHGLARVYIGGLVKDIVKETVESWFSNVGPIRKYASSPLHSLLVALKAWNERKMPNRRINTM